MVLGWLDWAIIIAFLLFSMLIGIRASKSAGKSADEFFLSGRNMPWWLLGFSMVATTFSCDTPNLVTGLVRKDGVSGNWAWWVFLITGMTTVFIYSKLWRRSKVLTDLEFYELRYAGKMATFLRGFRSIYLGVVFNIIIMGTVSLAVIKMGSIMLGLEGWKTLLILNVITVIYAAIGGLRGVLYTDFFQFIIAMIGSIGAAIYVTNLPEIGGLSNLLNHPNVSGALNILPDFSDRDLLIGILIIPLLVQWWSVWYPGAEPGGGGYIAQRMLAAKDERNAMGATLLFNIMHYAVRPWPWIIVALASMIIYPEVSDIHNAFPQLPEDKLGDDLGYPAMLTKLPTGLLGIIVASLVAAYMSTISTQLNWGSSYVSNDFYRRFVNKHATEKQLVATGRWTTVILMIFATIMGLMLQDANQGFDLLLSIGAGTGSIFLLRWFWWRVNSYSELAGMVISFVYALFNSFVLAKPLTGSINILVGVLITTAGWLLVTFLTRPEPQETLVRFYKFIKPAAFGWKPVIDIAVKEGIIEKNQVETGQLPLEIACVLLGTVTVYSALFSVGFLIYGKIPSFLIALALTLAGGWYLSRNWGRLKADVL